MNSLERRRLAKNFPGFVSISGAFGPDDRDDYTYKGDDVPCCYGGMHHGPAGCTCWEPVYDVEQADPSLARQPETRATCCGDCAYRNGSPERDDDFGVELRDVAGDGSRFYCHVGMRRVAEWRHPSGRTLPGDPADYRPPVLGEVAFKADGTPASLCAGWAAHRRALLGADV